MTGRGREGKERKGRGEDRAGATGRGQDRKGEDRERAVRREGGENLNKGLNENKTEKNPGKDSLFSHKCVMRVK